MNRSYSKIRHIQEANLVLENRRLEEKSKQILMEQADTKLLNQKLERYASSVKRAIIGYENAVGLEQKPDGGTMFGQVIYTLPVQFPKDQSKVLSNLQKIRNIVLGVNDPSKKLQYICVPKINSNFSGQFKDAICEGFNAQLTSQKLPKYKEMNAAFDDLYRYLTTQPTQK
jgi:hypothetical protein